MKRNAITRIVIYSIVIVILSTILLASMSAKRFAALFHTTQNLTSSSAYTNTETIIFENYRQIERLEIDWTAGTVLLSPSDVSEIVVIPSASEEASPWKVEAKGSTLHIQSSEDTKHWGINVRAQEKHLVIDVPRDWECKKLTINTASAQVTVEDMTIHTASINTASGDCFFRRCAIDSLEMDSASAKLEFSGTLNEFDCNAASGSAQLELLNQPKKIEMDSASGNMDLTLPEDCGFTAELNSLSGKLESSYPTTDNKNVHTYGSGACRIEMDGASGKLFIRKGIPACLPWGTHTAS